MLKSLIRVVVGCVLMWSLIGCGLDHTRLAMMRATQEPVAVIEEFADLVDFLADDPADPLLYGDALATAAILRQRMEATLEPPVLAEVERYRLRLAAVAHEPGQRYVARWQRQGHDQQEVSSQLRALALYQLFTESPAMFATVVKDDHRQADHRWWAVVSQLFVADPRQIPGDQDLRQSLLAALLTVIGESVEGSTELPDSQRHTMKLAAQELASLPVFDALLAGGLSPRQWPPFVRLWDGYWHQALSFDQLPRPTELENHRQQLYQLLVAQGSVLDAGLREALFHGLMVYQPAWWWLFQEDLGPSDQRPDQDIAVFLPVHRSLRDLSGLISEQARVVSLAGRPVLAPGPDFAGAAERLQQRIRFHLAKDLSDYSPENQQRILGHLVASEPDLVAPWLAQRLQTNPYPGDHRPSQWLATVARMQHSGQRQAADLRPAVLQAVAHSAAHPDFVTLQQQAIVLAWDPLQPPLDLIAACATALETLWVAQPEAGNGQAVAETSHAVAALRHYLMVIQGHEMLLDDAQRRAALGAVAAVWGQARWWSTFPSELVALMMAWDAPQVIGQAIAGYRQLPAEQRSQALLALRRLLQALPARANPDLTAAEAALISLLGEALRSPQGEVAARSAMALVDLAARRPAYRDQVLGQLEATLPQVAAGLARQWRTQQEAAP